MFFFFFFFFLPPLLFSLCFPFLFKKNNIYPSIEEKKCDNEEKDTAKEETDSVQIISQDDLKVPM